MPTLMSCSVQFSVAMFFQPTSETSSLLCLAEVARLPLEVSSYHVFNWCLNREAVVYGQFSVAMRESDNDKSSVIEKHVGLHLMLLSAACN